MGQDRQEVLCQLRRLSSKGGCGKLHNRHATNLPPSEELKHTPTLAGISAGSIESQRPSSNQTNLPSPSTASLPQRWATASSNSSPRPLSSSTLACRGTGRPLLESWTSTRTWRRSTSTVTLHSLRPWRRALVTTSLVNRTASSVTPVTPSTSPTNRRATLTLVRADGSTSEERILGVYPQPGATKQKHFWAALRGREARTSIVRFRPVALASRLAGVWLSWLERSLHTAEVTGSSPVTPTTDPQVRGHFRSAPGSAGRLVSASCPRDSASELCVRVRFILDTVTPVPA